jgi:ERI1 exoribonuclease 3
MSQDSVVISSCPSSPTLDADEHAFDYLIVIDFEATCDNGDYPTISLSKNNQEMIEFPFVLVKLVDQSEIDPNNPQYAQILHTEQHYVKPEYSSRLTPFCTELTGITDHQLQLYGRPLIEVINHFDGFIEHHMKDKRFCILTDGEWDLKQLLIRESKNKQIPLEPHYYQFFDLRKEYKRCFPEFNVRGLSAMVEHSGIQFFGRHHSGIDDCMTIVQIIDVLLRNGHKFKDPCVISEHYDPFRDNNWSNFRQSPTKETIYRPSPPTTVPAHQHYMPAYYTDQQYYLYGVAMQQQPFYNPYYSYGAFPVLQESIKRVKPKQPSRRTKGKRAQPRPPSGISSRQR